MANNTFQLKRSLTTGNVPSGSQLTQGELAINIPDHRLFTKDESNTVVDVFGQSVNTTANVQFRDGTLSGNLNVVGNSTFTGSIVTSNTVTGTQIISSVPLGTAPLQVTSTTVVANLNADYLDGQHGSYYSNLQNSTNILNMDRGGSNSNLSPVAGGLVFSNTQGLSITVAGTTGQYLISNGTSTPIWKSPADLAVGYAWTVNNGVYTTTTYNDPTWLASLDKAKVGLGNVTNESKAVMFTSPTFTGDVTATGDVLVQGDLTVYGTQFTVSTDTSSYTAGVIDLHAPATGWITSNDGKDIGLVMENYDPNPVYAVITGGSANGSVATLQVPRGGAYFPGAWVTVDGVVPSEFNGTFKVTSTTSNTFSFALASSNTVVTTGHLGRSTRVTEIAVVSGNTVSGSKISTINYDGAVGSLSLSAGDIVTITGCDPIQYNGTWTVLTSSAGTFTFQNNENASPITTAGTVVLSNRKAFLGWSNDEKSLEYYKVGAMNPNGTFNGIYGVIKTGMFHAAPAPAQDLDALENGMTFRFGDADDRESWDAVSANNGTINQVKVMALGSQKLSALSSNVSYGNAATVYITGAPEAGNNVSIGNSYAIQVASGKSLFGGNVEVYGTFTANDFIVQGNLTVSGTTTYINTQTMNVGDNIITLNADLGAVTPTENAGIEVNRGSAANVSLLWDETNDRWSIGNTYATGDLTITANAAIGGGLAVTGNTNISGRANVAGNVAVAGYIIPITNTGVYGNVYVTASADVTGNSQLRVTTQSGWVDIGAKNTSYAHFTTDRTRFYFDHEIQAATGFTTYTGGNQLWNSGLTIANGGISVGNSTVNATISTAGVITGGNTTIAGFVNASAGVNTSVLSVGTAFVADSSSARHTTGMAVGSNLVANTTGLYHTGVVNAAIHTIGTDLIANSTGVFHTGVVNAAVVSIGTAVVANASGVYPSSNTVGNALGATNKRWVVTGTTGNFSGSLTVANTADFGNTTITGWANVTANVQVQGALNANDVNISGNLTVSGTTTYINTTQLNIGDNLIVLNADVSSAPTEDAGIIVNRGTSANVEFSWSEDDDHWNIGNTHITGTLTANSGSFMNFGDGAFFVNTVSKFVGIDNADPQAPLTIGSGGTNFTNPIIQFSGNADSYIQLNGQNANTGNNASSDLMLISDNGTDTTNYIDVGINSSTYNQTAYGLMKPNAGYLFVNGGDLTIGTQTNHDILFHTGNTTANSVKAGIYANGNVGIANSAPVDKLAVQGYIYTSEGVKIGDDVIRSIGYLDAATYTGGNIDVSPQEPTPTGMAMDEVGGAHVYLIGSTNKTIYQYDMGTPFSVSTAAYSGKSFAVTTQDTAPTSIFIKPDGTKMYMLGDANDRVYEYNLSTAWDVSTATFVQFLSVSAQTTSPQGMSFSDDGLELYVTGGSSVYRYTLSSAWNISTASFVSSLDVSAYESSPRSVDIENNGFMLIVAGSGSNQLVQYNLTVAYDITSAVYHTRLDVSQTADLDCHSLQESRGGLVGQYAYVLFGDKARVFEFTTISPAAQLSGSRFIVDADIHMRGHMAVYERTKFSKGIDSYGNSTVYNLRANNVTLLNGLTANTLTADINLGFQQTTGNVIVGGASQTGYINIGRSAANQSVEIANGATSSGNKKIVNVGTGGLSGSNTTITLGSDVGVGSIVLKQLTSVANNLNVSGTANVGVLNVTGSINRDPVITTTLTGDLTGTSSATLADLSSNTITISTTLANTAVAPGTYGNTTYTPVVTVDSKGRVTSLSAVAAASVGVTNFDYYSSNNTFKIITGAGDLFASFDTVNTFNVTSTLAVTANATFDSGTLFVDATNNRVGIGNTTPSKTLTVTGEASISANTTVGGKLSHGGLIPTTGTDIDQIYSVTDSLTLTTSWQDTSINAAELATGTYIVQVVVSDSGVGGGQTSEYYSGIMSWYQLNTNSTEADEIPLHRAGYAPGAGSIFLRVQRTVNADANDLKLQIAGTTTNSGAADYVFKFRRMI